jgi:hypothetical protein
MNFIPPLFAALLSLCNPAAVNCTAVSALLRHDAQPEGTLRFAAAFIIDAGNGHIRFINSRHSMVRTYDRRRLAYPI